MMFPKDNIDPRDKDDKWLLNVAKAVWDDSKRIAGDVFYHGKYRFQEYRDYSNGKQDQLKYQNFIRPKDANGNRPEEFVKLDYTIVPFMPKFKRIALGTIRKVGYNIVATAIDSLAQDDEDEYFADQKAKIKLLDELRDIPGIEAMLDLGDDDPRTLEEIRIKQEHSYKHEAAIEAEKGLDLVFSNNRYDQILNKVTEDLYDFGVGGVKRYFDQNGKIKIRHSDMMEFGTSYCVEPDFSDARYMYEVIYVTVGNLKSSGKFTSEEIDSIGDQRGWMRSARDYDRNKIAVLDFEYKTFDEKVYERYQNKFGNPEFRKTEFHKKKSKKGDIKRDGKHVIYKGKWIIGTDFIYDTGPLENMIRKKSSLKDTCFSWHVQAPGMDKMVFFGISEAMIPVADQIQLTWLKLQNFLLNVVPPGIRFDLDALDNINMGHGGEKWQPRKVVEMYKQRGDIAYRGTDEKGDPINTMPIDQMQGTVMGHANELMILINSFMALMRDNVGFNEVTDGSTPDPRMLNGVANLAYQSTSNALYHIVQGVKFLNENLADSLVIMMQDAFSSGNSPYLKALGINTQRFWKVNSNISIHELSVKLEDKPSDEEVEKLEIRISLALESQQITIADSVYLDTIHNIKEKAAVLGYLVNRNIEEQHAREMERINATVEGQQHSAVMTEEEKRKTLEFEHALKMEQLKFESVGKNELERIKGENRMREAELRELGRVATKEVENEGKETIKRMDDHNETKI